MKRHCPSFCKHPQYSPSLLFGLQISGNKKCDLAFIFNPCRAYLFVKYMLPTRHSHGPGNMVRTGQTRYVSSWNLQCGCWVKISHFREELVIKCVASSVSTVNTLRKSDRKDWSWVWWFMSTVPTQPGFPLVPG